MPARQNATTNTTTSNEHVLTVDNLNPSILKMEYAVRGPLVIRAGQLEKELAQGVKKPFDKVIKANIGDAHAMGNKPVTFLRQVLALVTHPPLLQSSEFPEDAKSRARDILSGCRGASVGSYSDSVGIEVIRRHVAEYIERRDGGIAANPDDIVLCAGASESIRGIMKLLISHEGGKKKPGVMIPIPQYPLYSATIAEYDLQQIGYYLNESNNWSLDTSELNRSLKEAKETCTPAAMVVINPGNPTGSVLTEKNLQEVIKFAHQNHLFLFADEVYQDNVYAEGCKFHSVKKVMMSMGAPYNQMELVSFMSCSKGYMGECGIRGGYVEICNMDLEVRAQFNKSISAKLCPTVIGQACMDVVVNPPKENEPSYASFTAQKTNALKSLAERAKLVADTLNSIPNFKCNEVQGAMYAFPQITFSETALKAAKAVNQPVDLFYAFQLLESTGICIIPGSGFGQKPGTYHFRTTILPQKEDIVGMLNRLKAFHLSFLERYQ